MTIRLDRPLPINADAGERTMLENLQGNILKGHGRNRTAHIFLRIKRSRSNQARAFFKTYAAQKVMSAAAQLQAAAIRRKNPNTRSALVHRPFVTIVLSKAGYVALGIQPAATPSDPAFNAGLKSRGSLLDDPPKSKWHPGYRGDLHAMILIGGAADSADSETSALVETEIAALMAAVPAAAITIVGMERGRAYEDKHHHGVEHFGYVDGRSQPLLLEADVKREHDEIEPGPRHWNPAFPLAQVLVKDPAVAEPNAFGSYFVFRKLEQNVKAFHAAEEALQKKLEMLAASVGKTFPEDLAGAMIVGRFEDGTPVVLQSTPGLIAPVKNNFGFGGDANGLKCPFHSHIRKTNPRGDTVALGNSPASERAHIMARRGITYGKRRQKEGEFLDQPSGKVGLLFMAYQANIGNQFEFTQASWANDPGFVKSGTGVDPIIGQGGTMPQKHSAGWNDAAAPKAESLFANFVSMKGGEYFFAPSLAFFKAL
jgi:Dyp-type peroxidase family